MVFKIGSLLRFIDEYIGSDEYVSLGDFTDLTLEEFFQESCDVDDDSLFFQYTGKNVYQRFMAVLFVAPPDRKAKIIYEVLKRFPLDAPSHCSKTRTQELYEKLLDMAEDLEGLSPQKDNEEVSFFTDKTYNQKLGNSQLPT
ncbi:hypothetical protein TUMEXPCC7403_13000 [Tumidithrix helvetica PCC 7403]|uniref:hypothetical protein n=1 Tax=Tumidithrix helvetica TaxID=3457545 RepID=UPI003C9F6363